MRDVIAFAAQRGALLHPEVLRWLQQEAKPLDSLQRALPEGPLPMLVTVETLQGQRGAVASPGRPPTGALAAAVAAARTQAAVLAQAPRLHVPVLPLAPAIPAAPEPPRLPSYQQLPPIAQVAHGVAAPPSLAQAAPGIEVLKDITGQSTCTGEMGDFTRYFNDRLRTQRRMLRRRREMHGHVAIDAIPRGQAGDVKLIGLVNEVRNTKNGYRILELEDETGTVPVLVPRGDHREVALDDRLVQDEVVGVMASVKPGKDLLFLKELFRPDVENDFQPRRASEAALACFVSDTHFGAKTYLADAWERFVRWLNGQEGSREQRHRAAQVRFLVIAGDMVDGIGVYPGQEPELAIPDIRGQYEFAAKQLARIPERVRVVMLPGNHDAVRPAEPQPAMAEHLRKPFGSNVTFVGNPCQVSLMGVEVLAYHGVSLIDYVQALRGLDVHHPIAIMEEALKRRHIAPTYGGSTPIAPEGRDYMVIERVPDVFVTGHLHTCDLGAYKGVTLINAGTWQAQTSYQKTLGIEPQPARVPVVDLQSGRGSILSFDTAA